MSIVFTDNFTVGADTDLDDYPAVAPDNDYEYINNSGSALQANAANDRAERTGANGAAVRCINAAVPTGDQQQTARQKGGESPWAWNLLRCGAPGAFNAYLFEVDINAANEVQIYRVDNGSFTLLQGWDDGLSVNGEYTIMGRAEGAGATVTLTIAVNGGTEHAVEDSSGDRKTSGPPGLGGWNSGAWVDDIEVDDLDSGGGSGFVRRDFTQIVWIE